MSYISKKKRSTNYIASTMFLVAGITTVAGNVSADTVTGWDTNGSNSANIGTPSKDLPDTYWLDIDGKTLKEKAAGQSLPDNDGVSDIGGYKSLDAVVVSENDISEDGVLTEDVIFEGHKFKVGDIINVYIKNSAAKVHTDWLEEGTNKVLKERADGTHPDDGKSDIDGYTLVSTSPDADGNVVNHYKKTASPSTVHTDWVDEQGNKLKDRADGAHSDLEGDDIKGYELVSSPHTDDNGNIINTYKPVAAPTPTPEPTSTPTPTPTPTATTPEPTPTSTSTPTPEPEPTPTSSAKTIPDTGLDDASGKAAAITGAGLLGLLGITGLNFKRRKELKDDSSK